MSDKHKYDFSKIFDRVLNRTIHKSLTMDLIENTSDTDLTQLIVDNIQVNNRRKSDGETYLRLSQGQKVIYSTYILETQIFNGGFEGFYLNTNCELNQFITGDLIILDAKPVADIVKRANSLLNGTESADLRSLDMEFHKLIEVDSLDRRRVKYIRENAIEFISP